MTVAQLNLGILHLSDVVLNRAAVLLDQLDLVLVGLP